MTDWFPPPMETFTRNWVVAPSLAGRYARLSKSASPIYRVYAMAILYEEFVPADPAQRRRYYREVKLDPKIDVQFLLMREYKRIPMPFLRHVRRVAAGEANRLRHWLDRIEGEAHPEIEVAAWRNARGVLDLSCNALRVRGLYEGRFLRLIKALDFEAEKRLPKEP